MIRTTPATPTRDADPTAEGGPSKLVLFGLLLGLMLGLLDGTIVGTALPTIVGDLGGLDHLSWVVTTYLLTASVSTPIWGKLGDLYGRKGSFLWSIAVFLAGSVLSGLAQDMGQLIAFRAVQGLGAGGLMVGAISIIGVMLPPSQAGRSQSMIGAMMPVALVGGPCSAVSSPTSWTGAGSSTSTCPSAGSPCSSSACAWTCAPSGSRPASTSRGPPSSPRASSP